MVGLGGAREAVADVLVALAEDLQVERQHQRGDAGILGALDQPGDEVAVLHHIELEPERLADMVGDVLERADAHGREREGDAGLAGGARGEDFAIGVLHAGEAGGGERDRHGDGLADHGRSQRAVGHVDGDALAQLDAGEIGLVGAVGALGPGAGIGVVVEHARHPALGQDAQILDGQGLGHGRPPPRVCSTARSHGNLQVATAPYDTPIYRPGLWLIARMRLSTAAPASEISTLSSGSRKSAPVRITTSTPSWNQPARMP
jgi:hypothetical protein